MRKIKLVIATVFLSISANAGIEFGVGTNSATGGRIVPALHGAITWSDWAISSTATGVNSNLFYHSSYTLSGYSTWDTYQGMGHLTSGFGLGFMYAARGFRDTTSSALEEATDFNFGPAFRMHWAFSDTFFINLETLFGLGVVSATLSFQDSTQLSIGFQI